MRIRASQTKKQPAANGIRGERLREQIMISVIVANYLHDARIIDSTNPAQQVGPVTVETMIDGDIPVRIDVQKESSGPAWINWHAWPDKPGRRTWGTMLVERFSATEAILGAGSYDRSRQRSSRLAKIPLPDAAWGLWSAEFEWLGIKTTF